MRRKVLVVLVLSITWGASSAVIVPGDNTTSGPALLSETGAFLEVRSLEPAPGLVAYQINAPFWSDGSAKRRWIALPPDCGGKTISYHPMQPWSFPAGTVFIKHFEFPKGARAHRPVPVETRLLRVREGGEVHGASYRWNADGTDAELVHESSRTSVSLTSGPGSLSQPWFFPGPADCRSCHTPQAGGVLGVNARQLNCPAPDSTDNQLLAWSRLGMFDRPIPTRGVAELPRLVQLDDPHASLEERARSYLDVNCAMCHQPGSGTSGYFDARYTTALAAQNLIDGAVMINLGADRARVVAPNDPWRSMLLKRMSTLDSGIKMPPLGHEVLDNAGVEVMRKWILSLPGPEVVPPPRIAPPGGEFEGPLEVRLDHVDAAAEIRYTLDGSTPRSDSPLYEKPLRLTRPATVRARAFKTGAVKSIPVQQTYTLGIQAAGD